MFELGWHRFTAVPCESLLCPLALGGEIRSSNYAPDHKVAAVGALGQSCNSTTAGEMRGVVGSTLTLLGDRVTYGTVRGGETP
jgi:hypothetical protein